MSTFEISSLSPEVEKRLREIAQQENKSVDQVVSELVSKSVDVPSADSGHKPADFEKFLGVWSEQNAQEFAAATEDFQSVPDLKLW